MKDHGRKFIGKIEVQTVPTLPVWSSEYEAVIIYVENESKYYFGNDSGWEVSTSGTSGTSGVDGTSGTSGEDGTNGSDGTSGSDGSSGTSGDSGSDGTSGDSGTSGSSGTSGDSGSDGTSGTSGDSGSSGSSGTSGVDGDDGTSGSDGSSGTSGVNGTSGTSGTSGTNGSSGSSGTSGNEYWDRNSTSGYTYLKNSTDSVGIGVSAPASPLEIQAGLTTAGAVLTLGTKETSVVLSDILGRINFYAPLEADGGDSVLVAGSIAAISEGTFSATNNATALIFSTGESEAATEKMRLSSGGLLGIGMNPTVKLSIKSAAINDLPTYGNELLPETTGWTTTDWTGTDRATGWTHSPGNTTTLLNSLAATIGAKYQISWTASDRTDGEFTVTFGGVTSASYTGASGSAWGPTAITTDGFVVTPTSLFDGKLIFSIKEITAISTPVVRLYNSGAGIRLEIRCPLTSGNILIGSDCGGYNTTGTSNTGIGYQALQYNTTGHSNNAQGYYALRYNTTGYQNIAIGNSALTANLTGSNNIAIGQSTLAVATSVSYNIAIGPSALGAESAGKGNIGLGLQAFYYKTAGDYNIAIGYQAASYHGNESTHLLAATNSIYIGYRACAFSDSDSNSIVIGSQADGMGANTVVIGNTSVTANYLNGSLNVTGGLTTVGSILTLGTKEPSVVVNDVLGRINFYAPLESDGGDAILVAGSIVAIAEDTFSSTVNKTSLVFQTGASEVATEKMRITSAGNVGIGVAAPATKLDVAGSMQVSSAVALSLGGYVRTYAEATGTPSGTTTYFDIAVDVPSGCKLLGCQLRVDTALTAGETWGAAYITGSTTILAAAGQAVAKNTKVNKMHVDEITSATTKVRITRDSGNFTDATGVIRAIVYYETFTAMGTAA